MILLVHLLFGAAIGSVVKNIPLAIILAFIGHYFIDIFPHVEYPMGYLGEKQWRKARPDILKIFLDFSLGILLILIFSKNYPLIYICALSAIVPDGFFVINLFLPNKILNAQEKFHEKVHFLNYKKIPTFWRIATQIIAVIISITLLKS